MAPTIVHMTLSLVMSTCSALTTDPTPLACTSRAAERTYIFLPNTLDVGPACWAGLWRHELKHALDGDWHPGRRVGVPECNHLIPPHAARR